MGGGEEVVLRRITDSPLGVEGGAPGTNTEAEETYYLSACCVGVGKERDCASVGGRGGEGRESSHGTTVVPCREVRALETLDAPAASPHLTC